jgi:hypothetical protein
MDLSGLPPVGIDVAAPVQAPTPNAPAAPSAAAHKVDATSVKKTQRAGTHLLPTGAAAIVASPAPLATTTSRPRMPKSKPWAARTPAAATPSATPPKNKQVVKRKSKPSVAVETTTVDPKAGGDFAEHNVFDKYTQNV